MKTPGSSFENSNSIFFSGKPLNSHSASLAWMHKWILLTLMGVGNPVMDYHAIQGGAEILLVVSCYITQR